MSQAKTFVFYVFLLFFVIFVISLCADTRAITNEITTSHFIFSITLSIIIVSLIMYWSRPSPEDYDECPICGNKIYNKISYTTCDNCGHDFNKKKIIGYDSVDLNRLYDFTIVDLGFILSDLRYKEVGDKEVAIERLSKIAEYYFIEDYINDLKSIKKEPRELCKKAIRNKKELEKKNSFDVGKAFQEINNSHNRCLSNNYNPSYNFLETGEVILCPCCGSVQPSYGAVCSICGADLLSEF